MKTWKLTACLVTIFAAGVLSGGLVIRKIVERGFRAGSPGEALAARWLEELKQRVDLTPEQTRQIAPVVASSTDDFVGKVTAEMLSSLEATKARVLPLLTPAQREKFLQMTKQQEEMIHHLAQDRPLPPTK